MARQSDLHYMHSPQFFTDHVTIELLQSKTSGPTTVRVNSPIVMRMVRNFWAKMPKNAERLFCSKKGKPYAAKTLGEDVKAEFKAVGITIKPHDARHLVATELSTILPAEKVRRIGRWEPQTTLEKVYNHSLPEDFVVDLIKQKWS